MQKFFESTLVSTYIKYLLANTPLPLYPTIQTGDMLIAGMTYIYKKDIIFCNESGKFNGIHADSYKQDHLYVSDDLYVTDEDFIVKHWVSRRDKDTGERVFHWEYSKDEGPEGASAESIENNEHLGGLTVTDDIVQVSYQPTAKFEIIGRYTFGQEHTNVTKNFVSNVNYYDPETHKALGDYLRCLRDIKGLDLMSLYNCFDYSVRKDIVLTKNGATKEDNSTNKVILVPIKFNKTYTISIECPFQVIACPVLFNGKNLLHDKDGKSLSDLLNSSLKVFNSLQFTNPHTITITNDPSAIIEQYDKVSTESIKEATNHCLYMYSMERYLYLAIQVPASNSSSIVVLEGDYSSTSNSSVASVNNLRKLSEPALSKLFRGKLSLLHQNDSYQHPFSDKLIEYLVRYTIDLREYIDENVSNVADKIDYRPNIAHYYSGTWDEGLRYSLYNNYMNIDNVSWLNKYDILGYVDLDIENAIDKGLLKSVPTSERGLEPYGG